tara:strand:+ start:559 stop:762 length:204 start_codon:yes stop_codon:yes gene_type:complete
MSSLIVDYLLSSSSDHPFLIWDSTIKLPQVNRFKIALVGTFVKVDCVNTSAVHYPQKESRGFYRSLL